MFSSRSKKNIRIFYLKFFIFLVLKFSVYLNRYVFVMDNRRSRWPSYIVKPLRNSPKLQGEFIRIQRRELSQNCFISRLKKGLLKRTEFAPKGLGVQESKQEVTKSYLTCQKNVWKNLSRVSNPLIHIQFVKLGGRGWQHPGANLD